MPFENKTSDLLWAGLDEREDQPSFQPPQVLEPAVTLGPAETRYRRLFEAAGVGLLILDADTKKITDANPFICQLLGYTHAELLGKELWEIGPAKNQNASREAFRILLDKCFIRYDDLPLQTKTGRSREVEFVGNVYPEDGRTVIQCHIWDITARKRTEIALCQAISQSASHALELNRTLAERTKALREATGELQAFSYSISHDLRSPVRALQGFAHLLLTEHANQLDTQGREYLERIARSALRLDSLICDVLNYTRVLHNPVRLARVDLDRLVHDILASYPDLRPTEVDLQVQGPLPEVVSHEGFLTQCISNLLSNAIKFVAAGTRARVRIWAESVDARVRLFFQDNGIGIAPENYGRIFGMFERIHLAEEFHGNGIGLTIARKAVERMGAQIGFESQLGAGSRFWLELQPICRPDEGVRPRDSGHE